METVVELLALDVQVGALTQQEVEAVHQVVTSRYQQRRESIVVLVVQVLFQGKELLGSDRLELLLVLVHTRKSDDGLSPLEHFDQVGEHIDVVDLGRLMHGGIPGHAVAAVEGEPSRNDPRGFFEHLDNPTHLDDIVLIILL